VHIKFTSTLTIEDENRIAPAVLKALGCMLELLPIAYRVRIVTVDSQVYEVIGSGQSPLSAPDVLGLGPTDLPALES
jgi:hypothetical protein